MRRGLYYVVITTEDGTDTYEVCTSYKQARKQWRKAVVEYFGEASIEIKFVYDK